MKILLIGGSGFVSGTLARRAVAARHDVWAVTRGQRPLPSGVAGLTADRNDAVAFERAIAGAGVRWDLAVDCVGYERMHARQDRAVVLPRVGHLVFISTDFVYDPRHRRFPQTIETDHYEQGGYGGQKRQCELELLGDSAVGEPAPSCTIVRPCHIYGPGSQLGCLPAHGRDPQLIERLRAEEPLKLAGGGHFLQRPVLADDLADLILSCAGRESTFGRIYHAAGPDIIESREYYRVIAEALGVPLHVEELAVADWLEAHPEAAPFLCHRIYDVTDLRADGLTVPATSITDGLRQHVKALLRERS